MGESDDNNTEDIENGYEMANGDTAEEQMIPSSTSKDGKTKKRAKTTAKAGKVIKKKKKKVVKKGESSSSGVSSATANFIKYAALALLVIQMVGLVLLMRYTRSHADPSQPLYLPSTAVFLMEATKLFICCLVIAYQSGGNLLGELNRHVIQSPIEVLKVSVPAFLYCVQNNLLYLALTYLDASTYQVCYQLKILTTALFSATLLGRQFSPRKWLSLVVLTVGVALVQVSGSGDKHSMKSASDKMHRIVGLVAVLCAACTSGFAGVYFEKILKGSQTSLWIRNVQMGLPSVLIAFIGVYAKDGAAVAQNGFLGGYDNMVWTVVFVQAAGGLIVAVTVKYADNVLKVFAASFSIIINCVISAIFFDFQANTIFAGGAGLVMLSTVMYSSPEGRPRTARKPVLPLNKPTGPRKSSLVM